MKRGTLLLAGAVAFPSAAQITIDFDTEDDGLTPLAHGQVIETDGLNTEFGTVFDLTISSDPDHAGGVIFDTDTGGPGDLSGNDPDLIVDLGNALALQNKTKPSQTGGFFDDPDDMQSGTGRYEFTMLQAGLGLTELTIIDGNGGFGMIVQLVDGVGLTRTYTVPSMFTKDIDADGPDGFDSLDLTILAPQAGEGGGVATAVEDAGFDPLNLAFFSIDHTGSGAIDDLTFIPAPSTLAAPGFVILLARRRRR